MTLQRALQSLCGIICTVYLVSAYGATAPERPLIVVPGILGSKLCDGRRVVWGAWNSLVNLELLDMSSAGPGRVLKSCGLIDEVQILGPLWSIRAYAGLQRSLEEMGYKPKVNLFYFHYDWRQSNVETAKEFAKYVQENVPPPGEFDVVAHSMGGFVTRIYLNDMGDSSRVRKVIYLGTPFLGSANTFGSLSEGWGALENWLAGGKEAIRRTLVSFPSVLELLPRYDECCYVREQNKAQRFIDPFDVKEWVQLGWLPGAHRSGKDRAAFERNLSRARELTSVLTGPTRPGLREVRFAGDAHVTRHLLGMPHGDTRPEAWRFTKELGDGTVPVWSAASNGSFDSLAGTYQSFSEHSTIFDDKWVQNQIRRELRSIVPVKDLPISESGRPVVRVTRGTEQLLWTVAKIEVVAQEPIVRVGQSVLADVSIEFENPYGLVAGAFLPVASGRQGDGRAVSLAVKEVTSETDIERGRLRYHVSGYTPSQVGTIEIKVRISSELSAHALVGVLPK